MSFLEEIFGIVGGFISYHIKLGQLGLADRKSLMCMGIDIGARDEGVVINFISQFLVLGRVVSKHYSQGKSMNL